jgi:hypothetical protein
MKDAGIVTYTCQSKNQSLKKNIAAGISLKKIISCLKITNMKPVIWFIVILAAFISMRVEAQEAAPDTIPNIFEKVEVEAAFPTGLTGWRKYLEQNLNANVPVDNGAPAGKYTVWVQFIVDKEGKISDIEATSNNGYGMEKEVIRIISKSGLWTPAIQKGRPIRAYRKQPVTFVVWDESFQIITSTPDLLYTNTDNEIKVTATRVKPEDIGITVKGGTVSIVGGGRFIIRANKPGRVIITVTNMKKDKEIGVASIEVIKK